MYATISADIVSSTTLSIDETIALKKKINDQFVSLSCNFPGFCGSLIKGDYIECLVPNPSAALRIALILKTLVKSFDIERTKKNKQFSTYGIRIAIGVGEMRIIDRNEDIMDGEAIYRSGRSLSKMGTPSKGTMTIDMYDARLLQSLRTITLLVDALLNSATRRQSEVLHYKLMSLNENEIASIMCMKQSAINQHSTAAKWYCIEAALKYFETLDFYGYASYSMVADEPVRFTRRR